MNEFFITRRESDSMVENALTPIYRNGPLFECDIREAAYNGIADQKQRSPIWKMLLHSYPYQPSKWEEKRKEKEARGARVTKRKKKSAVGTEMVGDL